MKYYIASDHAGFNLKPVVIELLKKKGIEIEDLGPYDKERVDYPDFAHKLSNRVSKEPETFGILICGSGIGMSIAANKHKNIRAALCHDAYTATMARAHNDANILCMGERIIGEGLAESIVEAWLAGSFEGGRHTQRVEKLDI